MAVGLHHKRVALPAAHELFFMPFFRNALLDQTAVVRPDITPQPTGEIDGWNTVLSRIDLDVGIESEGCRQLIDAVARRWNAAPVARYSPCRRPGR